MQKRLPMIALVAATLAGLAISLIENLAFGGEISPIVIVGLLLIATALLGAGWGARRWFLLIAAWVWLPGVHGVKHALKLPDTLHPNTYLSIAALGGFSLVVCCVGFLGGVAIRQIIVIPANQIDQ